MSWLSGPFDSPLYRAFKLQNEPSPSNTVSKLSLNKQLFEYEGSVAEWSACRSRSDHYLDLFLGSPEFKSSATLDRLAQWAAVREVAGSNLGQTNTRGLYITEENVLPL